MKICRLCKINKSDDSFWKDNSRENGRQSACIACMKLKYLASREKMNAEGRRRARIARDKLQEAAAERLSKTGCISCGEQNIVVLEFDHRNRSSKDESIAVMIQKCRSMKRFVAEMDKCDVLCANCHRIKTSHENGSWRLKYVPAIVNN